MCIDDFEFYCKPLNDTTWTPGIAKCDCGADLAGRTVHRWRGEEVDEWTLCPAAPRSALDTTELADPYHDCGYCVDGQAAVIHLITVCDRCTAAATVLNDWCEGQYGVDNIPWQLKDHWFESELYRSLGFGRIVWGATHKWLDRSGRQIELTDVKRWALQARIAAERTHLNLERNERLAEVHLAVIERLRGQLDALETAV